MVDVHNRETRSYNMSQIKCKNTRPEMIIRSLVHRMGYRYALHRKDLPGKPDLVLVSHRKIIFVHGCFWHMHRCRYGRVKPSTNVKFWQNKREGNRERDRRNIRKLRQQGWKVLVIWECQTKKPEELAGRILGFLEEK